MTIKTPEEIAASVVSGLSFASNRMVKGRLIGEQHFAAEAIAIAIREERERCAAVADRFLSTSKQAFARGQNSAAFNIGLAIREPDQNKWAAMADAARVHQ